MPHHWRPLGHERNSFFKCKQHKYMIPEDQQSITAQWWSTGRIFTAATLWRMIWAKSTYRNDSPRNPAVPGYRATSLIRSLIGQNPATAGFLGNRYDRYFWPKSCAIPHRHLPPAVVGNIKLMKRKAHRNHNLHGKIAASV